MFRVFGVEWRGLCLWCVVRLVIRVFDVGWLVTCNPCLWCRVLVARVKCLWTVACVRVYGVVRLVTCNPCLWCRVLVARVKWLMDCCLCPCLWCSETCDCNSCLWCRVLVARVLGLCVVLFVRAALAWGSASPGPRIRILAKTIIDPDLVIFKSA